MRETPSQTAGPFVHIGVLPGAAGHPGPAPALPGTEPAGRDADGARITVRFTLTDGNGEPVGDAILETWQADAAGRMPGTAGADPHVTGFGRLASDADGHATLTTIMPGRVAGMAPHIALWITARGINRGLQTRVYFPGDAHGDDPVLAAVDPSRRATLIARPEGRDGFTHPIRLQGAGETVFFDM
jgi:protocatechuate 3,4-dioxygenase alpha subunit